MQSDFRRFLPGTAVLLILTACGGGSSESSNATDNIVDTNPPVANITFPPTTSATEGNSIVVRGTASDTGEITVVRVNGINATSTDKFVNWEASIPLVPGPNNITVETIDVAQNSNLAAASAQILVQAPLTSISTPDAVNAFLSPNHVIFDASNNRALVFDSTLDALLSVDLTTGARTIISDNNLPNNVAPLFNAASGMALDSANNRILVLDGFYDLFAVDLTSGARTVISDDTTPNAVNSFNTPGGMVLDSDNNRVLALDSGLDALLAVDLTSGARNVISDSTTPDAVNPFANPVDLVLDRANNRVLVTEFGSFMLAVDLTSGARTIFSNNTTPDTTNPFIGPSAVELDIENNRVLVANSGASRGVLAVNLSTGARNIVTNIVTPDTVNVIETPGGLALATGGSIALVLDFNLDALFAVDMVNGQRVLLSR